MDNIKICNLFIKSLRFIKKVEDEINKRNFDNIEFNYDLLQLLSKIYTNTLNYFIETDLCNLCFNTLISEYILSKEEKVIDISNVNNVNCIVSNNDYTLYISNNETRVKNIIKMFINKNNINDIIFNDPFIT
jgi:hypothetical protein